MAAYLIVQSGAILQPRLSVHALSQGQYLPSQSPQMTMVNRGTMRQSVLFNA